MSTQVEPVTPNSLLRYVQQLLADYPEYGDNPILVEDEGGVLDLMHVTEVTGLNGQMELIIDKATLPERKHKRKLGDLDFTRPPRTNPQTDYPWD